MKTLRYLLAAASALVAGGELLASQPGLSAAEPPRQPVTSAPPSGSWLRAEDYRVAAIVFRLGAAGRSHCAEQIPLSGILFHHLAEYEPRDRAEAVRRYGLDRGMGVLAVIDGSPAAAAGLQAGDVVLAANGRAFPEPTGIAALPDRERWRSAIEASEAQLEAELGGGTTRLSLLREGRELELSVTPVPGCPARARLARSGQMNAFADGRYAIMTTGFLGFFHSDDELAVALAHELAHNILRHPSQLEAQGVPNGMFRHIGRNARLVRATEEEADRLAVHLLSAAGYDLSAIIPFWRRLYSRLDSRLQIISAHPSFDARERLIREEMTRLSAEQRPALP